MPTVPAATTSPAAKKLSAKQRIGRHGEDAALAYLLGRGLRLIERNFRCKGGEIDLIMDDGAGLIFVEVRQRADARYGGACASITQAKQRRLVLAAQLYLLRHKPVPPCRFDVIAIDGKQMTWLRNVIEA